MRENLESLGDGYNWYRVRRPEFATREQIPFRVSPQPLWLTQAQVREMLAIGSSVTDFVQAVDELYREESEARNILDRGKPAIFCQDREARYLFVRPDLIFTDTGLKVCEVETSPFGLALAELLNRGYRQAGFDTVVEEGTLASYLHAHTPSHGLIVYSNNTASYAGQMAFLADKVLSGEGRKWQAEGADYAVGREGTIYRGFYLYEFLQDMFVRAIINDQIENGEKGIIPTLTPYLEEKAILALLWDRRWQDFLTKRLGRATFHHLQEVVLPTWVVGEDQHFVLGVPDLVALPRSRRAWVLKKSGFSPYSSWSEGVDFLNKKSKANARSLLEIAYGDKNSLYIIQQFRASRYFEVCYEDRREGLVPMRAKFRITPYFSVARGTEGQLIAIKATGREKTDYLHTTTDSVNMAVAQI